MIFGLALSHSIMKKLVSIIILTNTYLCSFAQLNFGPKLTAMGENSAAISDCWSVNANPSQISYLTRPTLAVHYQRHGVEELSTQALGLVWPLRKESIGLYVEKYGVSAYHQIKASLLAAKRWSRLSLALRVNYHQLKIDGYGVTRGYAVDVGTSYKITDELSLGLYADNPFQLSFTSESFQGFIPSLLYFGCSYLIAEQVTIAATVRKLSGNKFTTGMGMEYQLLNCLNLRAGITIKPFKHFVGLGVGIKKWKIEATVAQNPFLVYSPQIGVSYEF